MVRPGGATRGAPPSTDTPSDEEPMQVSVSVVVSAGE